MRVSTRQVGSLSRFPTRKEGGKKIKEKTKPKKFKRSDRKRKHSHTTTKEKQTTKKQTTKLLQRSIIIKIIIKAYTKQTRTLFKRTNTSKQNKCTSKP